MQGERRGALLVIGVLAVSAVLGGIYGPPVRATSSNVNNLQDSVKSFTRVLSVVEKNYATPVDTDHAIYFGAIPGMLRVLDPHSSFFDPRAYANLREDQRGRYYGVGMTIVPRDNYTYVLAPMPGSPASRAGIRPGDVIMAVDSKPTEGLSSSEVADMLKGPKSTIVHITMKRVGYDQQLNFTVTRDEIPKHSVDSAFMLKPGVGYIKLSGFNETTESELSAALKQLNASTLDGLVLDLRGNPGGLLNEAVDVSDKLLQKGQIVVSQRGRAFPDQVYRASHGEEGAKFPIVVVVNRNTASAAEIVSGALQDHDRALIAGETTFGKGLVQTVFQISENTGLALTTYHYYTPSGRLIQRPYDKLSLYDYFFVRDNKKADKSNQEVKLTDSGRTVYGGGGITPDEKIEVPDLNRFQQSLYGHYIFVNSGVGNFTKHYIASHPISKDFVVDDNVMQQFKAFLKANQVDYTDQDIAGVADWIKGNIKAELFTAQFGQLEGLKVRVESDPEINKAVTFLPEALALENRGTKQQSASLR